MPIYQIRSDLILPRGLNVQLALDIGHLSLSFSDHNLIVPFHFVESSLNQDRRKVCKFMKICRKRMPFEEKCLAHVASKILGARDPSSPLYPTAPGRMFGMLQKNKRNDDLVHTNRHRDNE